MWHYLALYLQYHIFKNGLYMQWQQKTEDSLRKQKDSGLKGQIVGPAAELSSITQLKPIPLICALSTKVQTQSMMDKKLTLILRTLEHGKNFMHVHVNSH